MSFRRAEISRIKYKLGVVEAHMGNKGESQALIQATNEVRMFGFLSVASRPNPFVTVRFITFGSFQSDRTRQISLSEDTQMEEPSNAASRTTIKDVSTATELAMSTSERSTCMDGRILGVQQNVKL
jgi:hypothetical protein